MNKIYFVYKVYKDIIYWKNKNNTGNVLNKNNVK